jgi:thiol-disulfide isomerase/thioredoxin
MRAGTLFAVATTLLVSSAPIAADGIGSCVSLAPDARMACLETALAANDPLDPLAIEALDAWIADDAAGALRAADLILGRLEAAKPSAHAAALEYRGLALSALGRHAEAAAAFAEVLRRDDGVNRVTWWSGGDSPAWTAEIDVPTERLVHASRAFAAAGDAAAAGSALERARRLGSAGVAEEGADTAGAERLVAESWYEPAAEAEIALLDGEPISLVRERGRVVLIDFWATWCEPCTRELPQLEALYRAREKSGLVAVAVNVGEEEQVVRSFVGSLRLGLPVGLSDPELTRQFDVDSLPTLIAIDRRGRLRGRWNGYREDLIEQVAGIVDALIAGEGDERDELARVSAGSRTFEVAWSRRGPAPVDGVTFVPGQGTHPGHFVIASDRQLVPLGPTGSATAKARVIPYAVGTLRASGPDGQGRAELFGFRRGGKTIAYVAPAADALVLWEAAAPVFDLWPRTASGASGSTSHVPSASEVWLATLGGFVRTDARGRPIGPTVLAGEAVLGLASDPGSVILATASGSLVWLDGDLREVRRQRVAPALGGLASAPGVSGVGVLPETVIAVAAGRFLAGGVQLALATRTEQLVVLDPATGRELFRARWPGIRGLAAGDLEGDGLDEIAISSGYRLTVLRAVRASAGDTAGTKTP